MEIETERNGSVLVARVQDRIDGLNAQAFQEALLAAIEDGDRAVVLDLARLTYVSSAGLRVILLTAKTLQQRQGNLAVCALAGTVREVFRISGFDKIIQTHGSEEEATAALAGRAG